MRKKILDSPHLPIPLITTKNRKDRTLDSRSILIFFSNTGSKWMNTSTRLIGLVRVAYNQAVANEGWIARYFVLASGFSPTNFRKKNRNRKMRFQQPPNETFCLNLHPPTIKAPPKNKNQQNFSCLPLIAFLHKVHNMRIEKQTSIPS